jgi:hypothetical protein
MTEFIIEVEELDYSVKSTDDKIFSILLKDREIFRIKRVEGHNIYYKWENHVGYHSNQIERLGSAIDLQICMQ